MLTVIIAKHTADCNGDLHSGEKWTTIGLILQDLWKQEETEECKKDKKEGTDLLEAQCMLG